MNLTNKRFGFTLVEMIIVITIFFVLMTIVFGIYTKMIKGKYAVEAKESLIQNSYYIFEKINVVLKDYTIDYEEYFNRKMVGCDNNALYGDSFVWNVNSGSNNGYCDKFTSYGNKNSISTKDKSEYNLYYCSSIVGEDTPNVVLSGNSIQEGGGCFDSDKLTNDSGYRQNFGQYKQQFRDYKDDVDSVTGVVGDSDDENVGIGPIAIADSQNIKELYLISQDGTQRMYFRRAFITSGDWNKDGTGGNVDSDKRYNLQMLKLRGFDAGTKHNFGEITNNPGLYDGTIDTRTCDSAEGFVCGGSGVGGIYSGFNMPADADDGRVNMFEKNLTISDRNIVISPTKDSEYSWSENNTKINPYFIISMTTKLYGQIWFKKLGLPSLDDFQLNLQTTFNTKNNYTR